MEPTQMSINRWVDKEDVVYISMEYYPVIKMKLCHLQATWMDLEISIPTELNQRQVSYDITYKWNLKKSYKWTCLQNRLTDVENKCMVTKGEEVGNKLGGLD